MVAEMNSELLLYRNRKLHAAASGYSNSCYDFETDSDGSGPGSLRGPSRAVDSMLQ